MQIGDNFSIDSKLYHCGMAVIKHFDSIAAVKNSLSVYDFDGAAEAFAEIPEEDRLALNVAPTKGGIWTLEETKKFTDPRWSEARKRHLQDR